MHLLQCIYLQPGVLNPHMVCKANSTDPPRRGIRIEVFRVFPFHAAVCISSG